MKPESIACRALLVSATSSNQGKTTITAALARHFSKQGMRVRVFKTGPDFIDPMILQQASGHAVHQLDLWMGSLDHCRSLLNDAAGEADLILVEGVMGLFDGNPCSADLAQTLGIPVLAVIDASAMAQTFAAVAHGLRNYRSGLPFAGVIANRVGSARHAAMLLPQDSDIRLFATLPANADYALPGRHLGLLQASEVEDIDARLDAAANALQWQHDDLPIVQFNAPARPAPMPSLLRDVRIAVARDAAFSFLYQANLDCLRQLGAELVFFSPLHDAALPQNTHSVYLPGGYPELHLSTLQDNASMRSSLQAHVQKGKPVYAECGGMLYLLDSLTSVQGERFNMLGLLPGDAHMQTKLSALALQGVSLPLGEVRGHSFHYSTAEIMLTPIAQGKCPNSGPLSEGVYRHKRITAGYIHFYFPSNPAAIAPLFLP
ncbi:MAG TPA: cobyrinate a,c-diamide synthase [Gallionellaceae bacterium]|nr:cobyrinate a,c-diamide synthase [Gallionellaceae bacterium]